jgi:hypothetical protein
MFGAEFILPLHFVSRVPRTLKSLHVEIDTLGANGDFADVGAQTRVVSDVNEALQTMAREHVFAGGEVALRKFIQRCLLDAPVQCTQI